ncbi:hypothetical protein AVEN_166692-1 [Araneus ventricosus]|uniref:Uncharacterized protein n=1 Tax=Araneus ventricosus TaxID=182803 RepID=A0A4Y2KGL2_ARAVE|nr:hypothetical protein AVEN_166692-1 [Araneus ventricosus]
MEEFFDTTTSCCFVSLVGLPAKMVRHYVRKPDRGNASSETVKAAVLEVKLNKKVNQGRPSGMNQPSNKSLQENYCPSLEDVRPFLKAQSRNSKSAILTDSPVKKALRDEQTKEKEKKKIICRKGREIVKRNFFLKNKKARRNLNDNEKANHMQ